MFAVGVLIMCLVCFRIVVMSFPPVVLCVPMVVLCFPIVLLCPLVVVVCASYRFVMFSRGLLMLFYGFPIVYRSILCGDGLEELLGGSGWVDPRTYKQGLPASGKCFV